MRWWLHAAGLLVALAILLAAEFFVYRPIDRQVDVCTRHVAKLRGLLEDENRVRQEHAQAVAQLQAARDLAATLNRRIPDEPSEADFLAQVSQLATDECLEIQDYRPGAITTKDSYSALCVELVCEGDYASLCNFLAGLSKLPRHATVAVLEIDSGKGKATYSVKLSLELYFAAGRPRGGDGKETPDV
jgi:Tfp pilus assembly protein PilO